MTYCCPFAESGVAREARTLIVLVGQALGTRHWGLVKCTAGNTDSRNNQGHQSLVPSAQCPVPFML
ncbi:hypothetical protein LBMAG48_22850 [Phycisphaerae bacterium]|nr:hypothetical protein LBMAG48_22850 [Phycisphaerae bacterium]